MHASASGTRTPRWVSALKAGVPGVPWFVRARFGYLFRELLGRYEQSGRLLYVTDGGHIENLGLVEVLRRGCTEVWCFDAAGDHTDTFRTIGEAIALAREELGVEIELDPSPMVPTPETPRRSPADAVVGRIKYGNGRPDGILYYAKTAVTSDAPWDVQAFADHDVNFPTHSTGDQLFDHEQFEAYRALGHFTAARVVSYVTDATRTGTPPPGAIVAKPTGSMETRSGFSELDVPQDLGHQSLELQSGQGEADATAIAAAERHEAVRQRFAMARRIRIPALGAERFWLGPQFGQAVRDVHAVENDAAAGDGVAAVFEVVDRLATALRARRPESQRLVHNVVERGHRREVVGGDRPVARDVDDLFTRALGDIGICRQRVNGPARRRTRRVVAGGDEADDLVAEFLIGELHP